MIEFLRSEDLSENDINEMASNLTTITNDMQKKIR
jgi:hypothetical protein